MAGDFVSGVQQCNCTTACWCLKDVTASATSDLITIHYGRSNATPKSEYRAPRNRAERRRKLRRRSRRGSKC